MFFLSGYDDWNLAYIEIQRLSAKWKELGIVLGISGDKLDAIAGNHQNLTDRLANVLQQWIGQNYNTKTFGIPSWRTLCGAIQKVSDNTFFEAVAAKHPSKLIIIIYIERVCFQIPTESVGSWSYH